jgi:asparagine synthase (glutamine-hydrolysing)
MVKKRYWQLDYNHKPLLSEKEWITLIREKLEQSVKLRMISDVPIGVLLSGGLDSSAVTAMMANLSNKPINSFTIKYEDKEADESAYAKNIADTFHTNHVELEAKPEAIEILPELIYDYAQPFADNSAVVTFMVSRLAKKYVTVALNGDGGDENFAGYDKHLRLSRDASFFKYKGPLTMLLQPALNSVAKVTETDFIKRAVKYMNNLDTHPLDKYIGYESFFQGYPDQVYKDKFADCGADDYRDRALYSDISYFLPDDLLLKTDIAGMRSSLEYRSPLLDQEMVELAAKIPFDLKVKNRETKYIFKKAMEGIVPDMNIYRKKMGFTIPLGKWFSGSLHEYAEGVLLAPNTRLKYLINRLGAKEMLLKHSRKNDYGLKLWCLLTLELWFERFF